MRADRRRPMMVSHVAALTVVGSLVLLFAEAGAVVAWRDHRDRVHSVSAFRLEAAADSFRPSTRPGLSKPVDAGALDPAKAVRSDPAACAPLSILSEGDALDGRSWRGASGTPLQPVSTLTVRYADAAEARGELRTKEIALLRCRSVRLTFPPFDEPAQTYTVDPHWSAADLATGRLSYTLSGDGRRFEFYVRRYVNTLTWVYDDDVSTPAVRHQIADSLIVRLQQLDRE